ncbi:PhnD/SsuA/transferrin family substrate-binding protein [Halothiobacillus sp.]|uniref:phosphate/phosphite/phosphonate ABC transporter substrate-binding protein n=1 Tax=Halothiobacillus sp. TaxID=1891311 RepID=UPI00262CE8A4|nr:PhnD/SsuA/transferrin family substrate-binding protein [Halothiobacillus sp.]MDD4965410.1 PhnD/SsuA/transferrin family substrate-binding protein [Halothiobacillus sp.]
MRLLDISSFLRFKREGRMRWLGRRFGVFAAMLLCSVMSLSAQAAALKFAIPPFLPKAELEKSFGPLVQKLREMTGTTIEMEVFPNYLAFWQETRTGSPFDIALDAAPTTDFRVQRQHWHVIAKLSGTVTQSLVTGPNDAVLDPSELINKKIAVQPSPSVSALTLYQLFPNPVQQPQLVFVDSNRAAADAVKAGTVAAAVIPTPIAAGYPSLNVVTTTAPLPFLAVSVSPSVSPELAKSLQSALIRLSETPEGEALLKQSQLRAFTKATDRDYAGQEKLLEGTFGY